MLIGFSSDNIEIGTKGESSRTYVFWACGSLLCALLLICLRTTAMKYYFGDAKEVNISAVFNVNILCLDSGFFIYFIILNMENFEYSTFELTVGIFSGIIFSFASYLITYVNIRGKAGVSDALVET